MKNHSDRLELFAPWYFLHFFICQHFLTQNVQLRPVSVVVLYPYLYICRCILICILRIFCICICQHLLTSLSRDRWVARNNGDWQILSISSALHSPQLHCTYPTSQYFPAPQKCTKAMKQMPKHDLFSDALLVFSHHRLNQIHFPTKRSTFVFSMSYISGKAYGLTVNLSYLEPVLMHPTRHQNFAVLQHLRLCHMLVLIKIKPCIKC